MLIMFLVLGVCVILELTSGTVPDIVMVLEVGVILSFFPGIEQVNEIYSKEKF